jgi:O-antigen/teichoic acid export membrane protein
LLTINFNSIGYAISLAAVPFLVALVYLKKLKLLQLFNSYKPIIDFKSFFLYGFYTSISGVLSQLLYAVDIILLGNILIDESAVALYKVSNIFPFSLLILPLIFMNTDFVKIANKSTTDKNYVKIYYLNYLKLFLLISLGVFFTFYFFSDKLLSFFGKEYEDSSLMKIFSIGVIGALLLRIPLGNILSAVGMVKINAINSLIILLLNLIFSYIFIQNKGTQGAAMVTACLMWFSGFLSLIYFIWFLKKEK